MPTGFAYLRYHRSALRGNCCRQPQRNADSTRTAFARGWRSQGTIGSLTREACSELEQAAKLSESDTGHVNTMLIPSPWEFSLV